MDIANRRVSRRQVLVLGLGLASLPLINACSAASQPTTATKAPDMPAPQSTSASVVATPAASKSGFDWKQQKGKSITVALVASVYYPILQKLNAEFENLTGITVDSQVIPEQQLRQKLPIELNAKSPAYDVYTTSLHVEKLLFSKAGWYEPLNKYLDNPNLTPPDYNWKDFGPTGVNWVTTKDGTIISLPGGVGLAGLMYRKDIYDAKGLKVPTTMDELVAAVKATHNAPSTYGFVGRGLKNANIPTWGMFVWALGGSYLDPSGTKLMTTSPEAVEAARIYADLMKNYSPPGSIGFNWNEAQGVFSQGIVACWTDSMQFAAPFEDASKSKVVGKVGYAPHPGSAKQKPFGGTSCDAVSLNPFAKNKEAAWLYAVWATSKAMQLKLCIEGAMIGTRNSTFDDPEYAKNLAMPKAWIDAVKASLAESHTQLPELQDISQFRDTFGVALTKAIEGGDPKTLLEQATKEFEPIFTKSLQN